MRLRALRKDSKCVHGELFYRVAPVPRRPFGRGQLYCVKCAAIRDHAYRERQKEKGNAEWQALGE